MLPSAVTRRISDSISAEMAALTRGLKEDLQAEIRQLAKRGMIGSGQTATNLARIGAAHIESRAALIWQLICRAYESVGCPLDSSTLTDLQREVSERLRGQVTQVNSDTVGAVPPLQGNLRQPILEHIRTTLNGRGSEQIEKLYVKADLYVASLQNNQPKSARNASATIAPPHRSASITGKVLDLVATALAPTLAQLHREHTAELRAIYGDPRRRGNHTRSSIHGASILIAISRTHEQRAIAIRDAFDRALSFQSDGLPASKELADALVTHFETQRQQVLEQSRMRLQGIADGKFITQAVDDANLRIAWLRSEAEHILATHKRQSDNTRNGNMLPPIQVKGRGRSDSRDALDRAYEIGPEIERLEQVLPTLPKGEIIAYSTGEESIATYLHSRGHVFSAISERMLVEHFRHELERRNKVLAAPAHVINFNGNNNTAVTGENAVANITINVDQAQRDAMGLALELAAKTVTETQLLAAEDREKLLQIIERTKTEAQQSTPARPQLQGLFTTLCMTLQTLASAQPAINALRAAAAPYGIIF